MDIQQARSRLSQIRDQALAIYEPAKSANRDLTSDEAKQLDKLLAEAEPLKRDLKLGNLDDFLNETPQAKVLPPQPVNSYHQATELYQPSGPHFAQGTDWYTRDGHKVHVLARGEKLMDRMPSAAQSDLTFGGFIRSMVINDGKYRNVLQEGTDSTGGYTVPYILIAQLIDRLRAQSVLMRAGATTMVLPDGGEVSMAKLTGDVTPYWHQESVSVSASTPSFGRVTFQPRTLIALVKASRELLEDSINVEEALMQSFAQALALEVDRVGLLGTAASGEPLGVLNTSGIGNVLMGANGAALADYSPFVNVSYQLTQDDAPEPTAFLMNPRTYTAAANLQDTTNQPMMKPEAIRDIPFLQTTQIPIDDTQGSATDASRVYAGYWQDLIWGIRHELVIEVLREKYSDTFEYGFMAHLRGDYVVRHAESFATIDGIIPA